MKHDREAIRKRLEALKKHVCGDAMKEIYGLVENLTGIKDLGESTGSLPIGSSGVGIARLSGLLRDHIAWRIVQGRGPDHNGWYWDVCNIEDRVHINLRQRADEWDNP